MSKFNEVIKEKWSSKDWGHRFINGINPGYCENIKEFARKCRQAAKRYKLGKRLSPQHTSRAGLIKKQILHPEHGLITIWQNDWYNGVPDDGIWQWYPLS